MSDSNPCGCGCGCSANMAPNAPKGGKCGSCLAGLCEIKGAT